jgi:hypothetical protein
MNEQETYEAIREFFSRPGAVLARARGYFNDDAVFQPDENASDIACFYRHPDDPAIRCSVGCVIPDELYEPAMETKSAFALIAKYPALQELFPWASGTMAKGRPAMLDSIQVIHDENAEDAADFVQRLDRLAHSLGLTVSV